MKISEATNLFKKPTLKNRGNHTCMETAKQMQKQAYLIPSYPYILVMELVLLLHTHKFTTFKIARMMSLLAWTKI
jgi:hypothetical protein